MFRPERIPLAVGAGFTLGLLGFLIPRPLKRLSRLWPARSWLAGGHLLGQCAWLLLLRIQVIVVGA